MKKTAFLITSIIISLIVLTIFFLAFISSQQGNYILIPEYTHSYTKALCSSEKYCKDFEIFCEDKNFIGMKFTGAAVQFPESWKDPRDGEMRNRLC